MNKRFVVLLGLCLSLVLSGLLSMPAIAVAQEARSITWDDLQASSRV